MLRHSANLYIYVQAAIIVVSSFAWTGIAAYYQLRGGFGIFFMIILPILLGLLANRKAHRRAIMPLMLLMISVTFSTIFGAGLWGYD